MLLQVCWVTEVAGDLGEGAGGEGDDDEGLPGPLEAAGHRGAAEEAGPQPPAWEQGFWKHSVDQFLRS